MKVNVQSILSFKPDSSLITHLMMEPTLGERKTTVEANESKTKNQSDSQHYGLFHHLFFFSYSTRLVVPGAKLRYALYLIKFL